MLPPTTVPAPQGGLETHAHKVGSCDSVRVWGVHRTGYYLLSAVVCSPPCQNGGSCVSPDHCVCTHGWTGADCSEGMLTQAPHDVPHSISTLFLTMHIHPSPSSPAAICNFTCQNGGHCSAPDRCNCTTGWEGQDCSSGKGEGL